MTMRGLVEVPESHSVTVVLALSADAAMRTLFNVRTKCFAAVRANGTWNREAEATSHF